MQYFIELFFVHDRSDLRVLIQRVAHSHLTNQVDEAFNEIVIDRALHQQAASAVAAFSHVKTDAKDRGIESRLQIGIGKDDLGILATEFETDLLQI